MDLLVKTLFGRAAEDIEYYDSEGYSHALCIDEPDALNLAIETAKDRFNFLNHVDMYYSPPYPEFHCAGYIVFKDEEAAIDIQREIVREGFECTRAKSCAVAPYSLY